MKLILFLLILQIVFGKKPVQNVQVTLRGEVYYVPQVTTAQELQERLQEESGLDPTEQGRVTFQGKVLEPTECLSDVGMKDGGQVNMIPKKMADHWKMMRDMGNGLVSLQERLQSKKSLDVTQEERKEMQIMTDLFENLAKVPYMQEEMDRLVDFLKQPGNLQRATDPERVESLRQIILNNPMFSSYMEKSPTTKVAIRDPDIWLQHVTKTVEEWKGMDGYQLWQRLIEGKLFG